MKQFLSTKFLLKKMVSGMFYLNDELDFYTSILLEKALTLRDYILQMVDKKPMIYF